MTIPILLAKPKYGRVERRSTRENKDEIERLEREIEELKRKL